MLLQVVNLLFMLAVVKLSEACNGYSLKTDYAKSCDDAGITIPRNMDLSLDKDCNLVVMGCIDVLKPIKTAKASYEITKAPMPAMTGEFDMCEFITAGKLAQAQQLPLAFGLPKKCPVAAKKYCVNGKKNINVSQYKNQLAMVVGSTTVKLNVQHDSGVSCIDMKVTFSKKK